MSSHQNSSYLMLIMTCVFAASFACNFMQQPIQDQDEFVPVCTPPACKPGEEYYCPGECPGGCGTTCISSGSEYNGCAFTVRVPNQLSSDGAGWDVWFTPANGEPGWAAIHARKMPGTTIEAAFEQIANQYGIASPIDPSSIKSVSAVDYSGKALQALQTDITLGDNHIRLLVVLRPDTLLGDLAPETVIYEVVAQTSTELWELWEPTFEILFQSFQPLDCGGV